MKYKVIADGQTEVCGSDALWASLEERDRLRKTGSGTYEVIAEDETMEWSDYREERYKPEWERRGDMARRVIGDMYDAVPRDKNGELVFAGDIVTVNAFAMGPPDVIAERFRMEVDPRSNGEFYLRLHDPVNDWEKWSDYIWNNTDDPDEYLMDADSRTLLIADPANVELYEYGEAGEMWRAVFDAVDVTA